MSCILLCIRKGSACLILTGFAGYRSQTQASQPIPATKGRSISLMEPSDCVGLVGTDSSLDDMEFSELDLEDAFNALGRQRLPNYSLDDLSLSELDLEDV